jgi:hypothetical protein
MLCCLDRGGLDAAGDICPSDDLGLRRGPVDCEEADSGTREDKSATDP